MVPNTSIESASPSASPSSAPSTPSTSASNSSTCTVIVRVAPRRRRVSTRPRRRCAVTSIALNANMKPTSALMTENSSSLWSAGAAAAANSRASMSVGSTLSGCPTASASSSARTSRSRPGLARTRIRVNLPRRPLASCAYASGAIASGLRTSGPMSPASSFAPISEVSLRAPISSPTVCSESTPIASATGAGSASTRSVPSWVAVKPCSSVPPRLA